MSKPETHDLSDAHQRYLHCQDHFDKSIRELAATGIGAGDILDAMSHIVASSCVMNEVSRDEFVGYLVGLYDLAKSGEHRSEMIHEDMETVKS